VDGGPGATTRPFILEVVEAAKNRPGFIGESDPANWFKVDSKEKALGAVYAVFEFFGIANDRLESTTPLGSPSEMLLVFFAWPEQAESWGLVIKLAKFFASATLVWGTGMFVFKSLAWGLGMRDPDKVEAPLVVG
jgi:hypothetical protein